MAAITGCTAGCTARCAACFAVWCAAKVVQNIPERTGNGERGKGEMGKGIVESLSGDV